ncbi:MAG: hypothetical protein IJK46_11925 [Prevotella sp.]|nr:hypothetical protein [Prevotella sp.]
MKKMMMAMVALIMTGSIMQTYAQQRRNSTQKRTTTTQKTTQRQKTTTAFDNRVAAYLFDCSLEDITVTQNHIYYVEEGDNNAVKRIDRKTGEVETVINGQAGVYEGKRAYLRGIYFAGGKSLYTYGPYSTSQHAGISIDGRLKTLKDYWTSVYATNGNYALIGNWGQVDCINLGNMTYLFQGLDYDYGKTYVLQPNGDIWWPKVDDGIIGVNYRSASGKHEFYSLAKESYIANEGVREIAQMRGMGNYIFVACKRRIYAMNVNTPGRWIEYVKVPPTMDYSFTNFWVNQRGDILGTNDMSLRGRVQLFRAEATGSPVALGRGMYIDTRLTERGFEEISVFQTKVVSDADNNWIMINGRSIRIFNPDGVVGYAKARGKVVKL